VAASLDNLVTAVQEIDALAREAAERAGRLRAERERGHSLRDILSADARPFPVELVSKMTDVFIEAGDAPDRARGQSRALITDWNGGSGKLAMVGDYTLAFRRTPQGWRIQSIACDLVPKTR
jgi:hypothetical protein